MQKGRTALYWAACHGYVNIVQALIDYDAAVDLGRDKVVTVMLTVFIAEYLISITENTPKHLILGYFCC